MIRRRLNRSHAALPLALSAAVILTLPGCYKRVVRAEGIGTEGMTVHQPSVGKGSRQGALDGVGDILFGPVQTERR